MNPRLKASLNYARKNLLLIILILVIVAIGVLYGLGFRIGYGVHLERVSTLTLTNVPNGSSIFIDQTLRTTTTATSSVKEELVSGSHAIIISAPGDYPWNTITTVASGKPTTVNPIFVSTEPHVTPLSGTAETAAVSAIASTTLPTFTHPLTLANGCAIVYASNNQVIADFASTTPGCTPPPYLCSGTSCGSTIIYSPVSPLKMVAPFPGRQDALVIQVQNILIALALDPRSPQFFAPILTATSPVIGTLPNGSVVIKNGTAVFRVKL
jgi:hypothetical protein